MDKKAVILISVIVILVMAAAVLFLYVRNAKATYPQLEGEWTEVGRSNQDKIAFRKGSFLYTSNGKEKKCSCTVTEGENYRLNPENALTISFPKEEEMLYDELVYHTQDVDGHTVRILDSFMFEDDGRGLIVFQEFVHSDDLQYVREDFSSDLYDRLNNCEAQPTYMPEE